MKIYLLGFALVVTVLWSPTFRANPPERELVIRPIPEPAPITGLASWYGEAFHGRTTASGEVYDMHGLTAAHRNLPLGTWAEITNLRNGRFVTVRINDRGPSIKGRTLDVSKAAAQALGFVGAGITTVQIRIVPRDSLAGLSRPKRARTVLVSASATRTPTNSLVRQ
jgi:rare lipoprotein A